MSNTSLKDRIAGTIVGTLVGDALGVGPHWYYVLDELKRDYGERVTDYMPPRPGRYHSGLRAGENSQTGQVVTLLLESAAEKGAYDETGFTGRLDGLLVTLDGTPKGGRYTDAAMRDVWRARHEGIPWGDTGSYADTAEAAIRAPVLAGRFARDFRGAFEHLVSNVALTHRNPFIMGQSVAFGLIVWGLLNEASLGDVVRIIQRNAREADVELTVPTWRGGGERVGFFDALLQPSWSHEAAGNPVLRVEPAHAVTPLFGLACTLGFMLPAAYYFASRFEDDFESAVLAAINGGGNNMARASLTGALSGAMVGLGGIPGRFITGLHDHERLVALARSVAELATS